MRVLIAGAGGQLGRELSRTAPPTVTVKAACRNDLDICDSAAVSAFFEDFQPTLVINAAAYTAVDKAESEPDVAWRINAHGPALLAAAARNAVSCRLIHISTDYVFDGNSSRPYTPRDEAAPLGIYGKSKLGGERAVLQELGSRALVLRTEWVFGPYGKNFVHTMLKLMRERGGVRVVDDQFGCPTATASLAEALWAFAARPGLAGVYHWTDAGVASWYDFAAAIAEDGSACGLLPVDIEVSPIATSEYPTLAKRPRFSVLDWRATSAALGISPLHWRVRLRRVLEEIKNA